MAETGDEWQVARRRKRAAGASKTLQAGSAPRSFQEPLDIGKTLQRIRDTVSELRCEEFWPQWKEKILVATSSALLSPPKDNISDGSPQLECVCYGLGPFSSSMSARYQLAMLLLLLDAAQISLKNCCVYDPVFTSGEREVLTELGATVLTENEEGKRLATRPTLFYLMHCGKALYNNLLWKNWSAQCLPRLSVIGNSFSSMRDRATEREFSRDYSYITQAVSVCDEVELSCPSRWIDVFSDTAVITFPPDGLCSLPQCTWLEPPEPQYRHCPDLEIIQRGTELREEVN